MSWKSRRPDPYTPPGPMPGTPLRPMVAHSIAYEPRSSVLEPAPEPPPPPPPEPYDEFADAVEERAAIARLLRGERS